MHGGARPAMTGPAGRVWSARLSRHTFGLTLAAVAYWLLSMQDATVKWLVASVPIFQVLFGRSAIVLVGCIVAGGRPLLRQASQSPMRLLLLCRGAVTLVAWYCYFTAARSLPLAQLLTLYFTAPVIVMLLAAPILREHIGKAKWSAVAFGFAGTVSAANPSGLVWSRPTALVMTAAGLWALGVILTRIIARREPSLVQMLYTNCFFLVATVVGTIAAWHPPSLVEIELLAAVGLLGGTGQLCLFEAARRVPASVAAPLEYSALLWAFLLGFLIWHDVPSTNTIIGASLILISGYILFLSERRDFASVRKSAA